MHVIVANFSDDSVALIQWAYEQNLSDCHVLYVDTKWQAQKWQQRIIEVTAWLKTLNFSFHIIRPELGFQALVEQRKEFPSIQFQWCPGLLKGIPILDWLEAHDEDENATILLPHRRDMSKAQADLNEYIEESEHYDDRLIWHPLYKHSELERNALVEKGGFSLLNHRSLECEPCIFSNTKDFMTLDNADINKTNQLEEKINQPMFKPEDHQSDAKGIKEVINQVKLIKNLESSDNAYDRFAQGCGWPYACGL
ncbi:phosphoadenosine phosphosulfate reductase family protein [Thiotrichales bacterium 19S9-12]|nr:phosphoadenosine phosphosulfate reductase family protein [Thiotrichales bacterium 19S9-11]MCF6811429.1 phosphoadenosine phosphosulfate reductase family protein [Thiotrichales bacterium 19S9-12]